MTLLTIKENKFKQMKFYTFIISLVVLFFTACNSTQNNPQKTVLASPTATAVQDTLTKIVKSEAEWKKELTEQEFYILRQKGTERSFTGDLLKNKDKGIYVCAACDLPLFDSETKFKSGTGWPSFWEPINGINVAEESDNSHGMRRVEVLCNRCGGHLGHVFDDGPKPTGLRYCINSVSLNFKKEVGLTNKK